MQDTVVTKKLPNGSMEECVASNGHEKVNTGNSVDDQINLSSEKLDLLMKISQKICDKLTDQLNYSFDEFKDKNINDSIDKYFIFSYGLGMAFLNVIRSSHRDDTPLNVYYKRIDEFCTIIKSTAKNNI